MKTRIFSRFTPIGRLSAAIVIAGTFCATALGQGDNSAPPTGPAAQELRNMQRLVEQSALPPGSSYAATPSTNTPANLITGPTFDLEVSDGHIVNSIGGTKGRAATVGNLVSYLQATVPNFNAIESPGVADVPLNNFKLRGVTAPTVLNILPSITGNKVQASILMGGARGRRGGPGVITTIGPAMPPGAVYRLDLIPPVQPATSSGGGSGGETTAASDAPARQMAVFNVNGYLAELAKHGKSDEKAIGVELMSVETIIGDSLQRLKGSPLTPDERPQFEVHYGAGIVVVIGPPQAIEVATKIINALPGNETSPVGDMRRRFGGAAGAPVDNFDQVLRAVQSRQNSYSNQPGDGAPPPAPSGGEQP